MAKLVDAQLVLADLSGWLTHRLRRWILMGSRLPPMLDDVERRLGQAGLGDLEALRVVLKGSRPGPKLLPLSRYGSALEDCLGMVSAKEAEIEALLAKADGDGWRPLESSDGGSKRRRRTTGRQVYKPNNAAG